MECRARQAHASSPAPSAALVALCSPCWHVPGLPPPPIGFKVKKRERGGLAQAQRNIFLTKNVKTKSQPHVIHPADDLAGRLVHRRAAHQGPALGEGRGRQRPARPPPAGPRRQRAPRGLRLLLLGGAEGCRRRAPPQPASIEAAAGEGPGWCAQCPAELRAEAATRSCLQAPAGRLRVHGGLQLRQERQGGAAVGRAGAPPGMRRAGRGCEGTDLQNNTCMCRSCTG